MEENLEKLYEYCLAPSKAPKNIFELIDSTIVYNNTKLYKIKYKEMEIKIFDPMTLIFKDESKSINIYNYEHLKHIIDNLKLQKNYIKNMDNNIIINIRDIKKIKFGVKYEIIKNKENINVNIDEFLDFKNIFPFNCKYY